MTANDPTPATGQESDASRSNHGGGESGRERRVKPLLAGAVGTVGLAVLVALVAASGAGGPC